MIPEINRDYFPKPNINLSILSWSGAVFSVRYELNFKNCVDGFQTFGSVGYSPVSYRRGPGLITG